MAAPVLSFNNKPLISGTGKWGSGNPDISHFPNT
jgi:hypothetical protein